MKIIKNIKTIKEYFRLSEKKSNIKRIEYKEGYTILVNDYSFLVTTIERADKKGVPANYYYSLGDAYRIKKDPGNAMTAYDKAEKVAKNKASVYTRMGTLWIAAQQWQQAKTN